MKTFKYKLYNNKKRNRKLSSVISLSGCAYNLSIAIQRRYYKLFKKHLSAVKLQAHLAAKIAVFKINLERLDDVNAATVNEIEWTEYDEKYQRMFWRGGYLLEIPSQALQQIVTRVENGYQRFFDNIKKKSKRKVGIPTFKSSKKYKSFTLKQAGYKYEESGENRDNKIVLLGNRYKFFKSRPIEGVVKTLSVKRNPLGEMFICFSCLEPHEVEAERAAIKREVDLANKNNSAFGKTIKEIKKENTARLKKIKKELSSISKEDVRLKIIKTFMLTGKTARGIDFGLKDFLVFNDGKKIASPEFLKRSLKELKFASREFSRKTKGSGNWNTSRLKLVRIHEKVANQRLEWSRKTAHDICKSFDKTQGFIFIEDLNLNGMKKLWGRKISDIAYGIFISELERIAKVHYGIFVIKIGRFEKSTGVCSETGLIKKLELSDREWKCDCGKIHDRDIESAKIICEAGLRLVGKMLVEEKIVRPSLLDGGFRAA